MPQRTRENMVNSVLQNLGIFSRSVTGLAPIRSVKYKIQTDSEKERERKKRDSKRKTIKTKESGVHSRSI